MSFAGKAMMKFSAWNVLMKKKNYAGSEKHSPHEVKEK
jgi:hypothetical protein